MDWHYVNWDVERPDLPDNNCEVLCRCISPDISGTPFVSYEVQNFSPSIGANGGSHATMVAELLHTGPISISQHTLKMNTEVKNVQ